MNELISIPAEQIDVGKEKLVDAKVRSVLHSPRG
jgi:hypothetical protein